MRLIRTLWQQSRVTKTSNSWVLSRSPLAGLQGKATQRKEGSSPSLVETETKCKTFLLQQRQPPQQKRGGGKFKGNWTRSFRHGCSRGKLLHEYPSGSFHMDSRRDPAVLLLIKTVVITFPILLELGLCGATAWRAENMFSWLTGSSAPLCYKRGTNTQAYNVQKGVFRGVWNSRKVGSFLGLCSITRQAQTRAPSSVERLP